MNSCPDAVASPVVKATGTRSSPYFTCSSDLFLIPFRFRRKRLVHSARIRI